MFSEPYLVQEEFYPIQYQEFYEQFDFSKFFYDAVHLFHPRSCYRQFLEHLVNSLEFIRFSVRILRNGIYYVTC